MVSFIPIIVFRFLNNLSLFREMIHHLLEDINQNVSEIEKVLEPEPLLSYQRQTMKHLQQTYPSTDSRSETLTTRPQELAESYFIDKAVCAPAFFLGFKL